MAWVGRAGFATYEVNHTRRTGWIVAPLMLVEALLAVVLAVRPPVGVSAPTVWVACGLLGIIWLSTAVLQVPMHRRLLHGFDAAAHRRLVSSNWIRTYAWTVRGILAIGWLW